MPVLPPAMDTSSAVIKPTGADCKPLPFELSTVNLSSLRGHDNDGLIRLNP